MVGYPVHRKALKLNVETRLPIPKNWQDFEMLCHKLWADIWCDPNAQRNGRQGQAQHGVDIFGKPAYQGFYAGVQCKEKDTQLGSKLRIQELNAECTKAKEFFPKINTFTMATTAARDATIQKHARKLNEGKKFPFAVHVWSWVDISDEIAARPRLQEAYYPNVPLPADGTSAVNISFLSHRDQCQAFFSRPEMLRRVPHGFREFLMPLCYELSDNAYCHGKATHFSIRCEDKTITLTDNGTAFNPIKQLDHKKVTVNHHVGSYVVHAFLREYQTILKPQYQRKTVKGKKLNVLTLTFSHPTMHLSESPCEVLVDLTEAVGREAAERLAASVPIPKGQPKLVLVLGSFYNISALVEFIVEMLKRIDAKMKLIIYLPDYELIKPIASWFNDSRLSIKCR